MATSDPNEAYAQAGAITPHDTNAMPFHPIRAIYVGGAGNVTVKMLFGGHTVLFTAPAVGSVIKVLCDRVMGTGTTATALVALA